MATALPIDDEMRLRIENHRKNRPSAWKTVEAPTGIAEALQDMVQSVDVVLLDCLTLLVNNLFVADSGDLEHPDQGQCSEALHREIDALLTTMESSTAEWIIVSNEVGLGLVPPYPLGRVYRDLLGWANQRLATRADEVYLMVAGMAVPLHEVRLRL